MPPQAGLPSNGLRGQSALPVTQIVVLALGYALAIATITFRTELSANVDGAHLLAIAASLAGGHGFVSFNGGAQSLWPPLYPGFIAIFVALGMELRWAAWLVNALTAFWVMWAVLLWLRFSVSNRWLILLGAAACALQHPLLELLSDMVRRATPDSNEV